MADDLAELRTTLRSLVVSSPTQIDVRRLVRDYRDMEGVPLPFAKHGYRDPVGFLTERFKDCFVFTGPPSNPILNLIVTKNLQHIDKFVQQQKIPSTIKHKVKRRSVPEFKQRSSYKPEPTKNNLIADTFQPNNVPNDSSSAKKSHSNLNFITINESLSENLNNIEIKSNSDKENVSNCHSNDTEVKENGSNETVGSDALRKFMRKRSAMCDSEEIDRDGASSHDSGKHTGSSGQSAKVRQFEQLNAEILELIVEAPDGVWCTDLIGLYKKRYDRVLNFSRFGHTSIISLVYTLKGIAISHSPVTGDWLLSDESKPPPARASRPRRPPAVPRAFTRTASKPFDPEDALPGIDFDPDVFPEDCLHFTESVPRVTLEDWVPHAMIEVIVGEVYSPSHFWLIRLGKQYNIAMEEMMDEMTEYYRGEGSARRLALGAVRVGHYCSSVFDGDWHRSLIVKILDSDTVKVRHVDYGTVDTVARASLAPLLRRWAALPAQAVRARLADVVPAAGGRRWPHPAAEHFLKLVRDRRLVANVACVDPEEQVADVVLVDTSGPRDAALGAALTALGHADPRTLPSAGSSYLYPLFSALEEGLAPSFADITAYRRDGIALEYVPEYRRHVLCVPAPAPRRAQPDSTTTPPPPSTVSTPPTSISTPPNAISTAATTISTPPTTISTPATTSTPSTTVSTPPITVSTPPTTVPTPPTTMSTPRSVLDPTVAPFMGPFTPPPGFSCLNVNAPPFPGPHNCVPPHAPFFMPPHPNMSPFMYNQYAPYGHFFMQPLPTPLPPPPPGFSYPRPHPAPPRSFTPPPR